MCLKIIPLMPKNLPKKKNHPIQAISNEVFKDSHGGGQVISQIYPL